MNTLTLVPGKRALVANKDKECLYVQAAIDNQTEVLSFGSHAAAPGSASRSSQSVPHLWVPHHRQIPPAACEAQAVYICSCL